MDDLWSWSDRVRAEFAAGNLTRGERDALISLMAFSGSWGLFPAEATVADRARCSVRTVQRAKRRAKELGLLDWQRRRRTSALYTLQVPAEPIKTRQKGLGIRDKSRDKGLRRTVGQQLAALGYTWEEAKALRRGVAGQAVLPAG